MLFWKVCLVFEVCCFLCFIDQTHFFFSGESFEAADAHARSLAAAQGFVYMSPHNDKATVAGYGTMGLELLMQNPYLDAVVIPVGSGSLLAATTLVLKHVNPRIEVFGVDSDVSPTLQPLLKANPAPAGTI
jgi:threonine dehydratase